MEPNLTDATVAALYAPTGGVICPFNLAIALGENANVNGVDFQFETEALSIVPMEGGYRIKTNNGTLETKTVVNAAGVYADRFHNMVSQNKIHITARKGEYLLFDKSLGHIFETTVFPLPGAMGKGILTSITIHGNMYVGPSANDVEDKEAVNTTAPVLDDLVDKNLHNYLCKIKLPMSKVITSFSGLRAHEDNHEFIVGEAADAPHFFDAAGIESPGLTSSPAIGVRTNKEDFIPTRKGVTHFDSLSPDEKKALIAQNPAYGQIVCRCEMITEAEIVDAINRPIGATSMDGIKRRTRAGTGRCQAGFCTPKTMEILARELSIPMTQVTKKGGNSQLLVGVNKELEGGL